MMTRILTDPDKNSLLRSLSIGKMGLCVKGKGAARYGGKGLLYWVGVYENAGVVEAGSHATIQIVGKGVYFG
jgi:hypothetical protein